MTVYGAEDVQSDTLSGHYGGLLSAVHTLFHESDPAVTRDETLAIFAFLDAAALSSERDGAPVKLAEVLDAAQAGAR